MTERVKKLHDLLLARDYRALRSAQELEVAEAYASEGLPVVCRVGKRLLALADAETPVLFAEDRIGMMRTIKKVPPVMTEAEREELYGAHFIFDGAQVGNISSDYGTAIALGLERRREEIAGLMKAEKQDSPKRLLYSAMLDSIDAVYVLADKYRAEAVKQGNRELAAALANVPRKGASSYYEALVFFRILNFTLWLNGNKHNTVGRFDQYMYPFYKRDVVNGPVTREQALELTEELFIALNRDSDLYPGVQQGDNGQSLVLGGCDENGNDCYNDLSKLCLEASLELDLIDPKINLRVNSNTPEDVYYLGTLLTKKGLGFPQYSNDDVVIPALVDMGYELRDARNYVVAACWEFIIPGRAMDIPNIDALSYPRAVDVALRQTLAACTSFEAFAEAVRAEIHREVAEITGRIQNLYIEPSPFQSILMSDCVREGKDISEGAKYNNFGLHGVGLSTAVDAMAAVKKCVFEDKSMTAEALVAALDSNFEGCATLRDKLLAAPKMGNNDDYADSIACMLTDTFADACAVQKNERGGIYRAGTGSAMYYVWYSQELGATADGRYAHEYFSANYSPSLNVRVEGVLSVIQSFTKPNLARVCNGGPLTLEFHDTLFRNEEGVKKVAALVKTFVAKGGHQLQLNAVNRETLLDAKLHPEAHKNLIVRVWGWSGYFNELDAEYQNHIIKRLEFVS